MSSAEDRCSMAFKATATQGSGDYVGRDTFQNGLLNRDNSRIFMAGWGEDWGAHPKASGYFTDQATIESCMEGNLLNTNKLDAALQTKLSDYSSKDGAFQAHSNVSAYDVDFGRLDSLNDRNSEFYNPELYGKLTNPDGLGTQNKDIKVGYGKVEANTQHGIGGGNQYYIEPSTFREAREAGIFNYCPSDSFGPNSWEKSIKKHDIAAEKYNENYLDKLAEAKANDMVRSNKMSTERQLTGQSYIEQINSQTVKSDLQKPYIARPDNAYGYGQHNGVDSTQKEKPFGVGATLDPSLRSPIEWKNGGEVVEGTLDKSAKNGKEAIGKAVDDSINIGMGI